MELEKEAIVIGGKAFAIHATEPAQLKMIAIDMPLDVVQRYVHEMILNGVKLTLASEY